MSSVRAVSCGTTKYKIHSKNHQNASTTVVCVSYQAAHLVTVHALGEFRDVLDGSPQVLLTLDEHPEVLPRRDLGQLLELRALASDAHELVLHHARGAPVRQALAESHHVVRPDVGRGDGEHEGRFGKQLRYLLDHLRLSGPRRRYAGPRHRELREGWSSESGGEGGGRRSKINMISDGRNTYPVQRDMDDIVDGEHCDVVSSSKLRW